MFNIFLQPNKMIDTPPIDNVYIFCNEPHNFSPCPYLLIICDPLFFLVFGVFFNDSKQSDLYAFSIFMLSNSFNFQDWDIRRKKFFLSPFHCSK